MKRLYMLSVVIGFSIPGTSVCAVVRYVKPAASGTGNCSSWANACTLSNAIATAVSGDRVWVKSGTYAPFNLKEGVKIIGGFAGTEFSVLQSDPVNNVTIVDGGGVARTVYGANQSASTMLRGFTIRNGFGGDDGGGGLMLSDSSALIVQCIFENNTASIMGGAVMVGGAGQLGSPQFINCIFRNNGSTSLPYEGGAVFLTTAAPVTFTNCLFHGNKAGAGGGVAKVPGTLAILTNCTMTNNQATMTRGGAVRDPEGNVFLRNSILWGNTRIQAEGPPLADQIYSPGNGAKVTFSDVYGGWPGTGNINSDPLFEYPAGNNYKLQSTSPCEDSGENASLPPDVGDLDWNTNTVEDIPLDLALSIRNVEISVDMGAYEVPAPIGPPEP